MRLRQRPGGSQSRQRPPLDDHLNSTTSLYRHGHSGLRTHYKPGRRFGLCRLALRRCGGGSITATAGTASGNGISDRITTAATTSAMKQATRWRIGLKQEAESFWRCWCSSEFRHGVADGARCLGCVRADAGELAAVCGGLRWWRCRGSGGGDWTGPAIRRRTTSRKRTSAFTVTRRTGKRSLPSTN